MLTKDLDYPLPDSQIAQFPAEKREESRLMVVDRASGNIQLDVYRNLSAYLQSGDCLALNDTRVIRARLQGHKASGGHVELFLLRETAPGCWTALVRPSAKVKPGTTVFFPGNLEATVEEVIEEGKRRVVFNEPGVIELLEQAGEIPLPPYIRRKTTDSHDAERYQTVYAKIPGAVAAPTAGLHLTDAIFADLDRAGIKRAFLTLHVGYGTFKPISAEALDAHTVDAEEFDLAEAAASALNETRLNGGRIVAVGTTCARVLETRYNGQRFLPGHGMTGLYIYPPYTFKAVDILQTNFHLPRSSLLALVCAFAGHDLTMTAYHLAVKEGFRFYSYGDVMLIR